ncbi:MAG: hypothetical protein ACREKM_06515 [Longimicrobiales bacterium]
MLRPTLLLPVLALSMAGPVPAQELAHGSIAVMPFGAAAADAAAGHSAQIIGKAVEEGLRESGRFLAVLERSAAIEDAVRREIDAAQGPASFDSYIRINTESQLNANYLMDGYVERQEVTSQGNDRGQTLYNAVIGVRVRIVDVETRALVMSEVLEVSNGILEGRVGEKRTGVTGFLQKVATDAVGSIDTSPEDALARAYDNAADAVREFLQREVSLMLVDYEVGADDVIEGLVLLAAPDLSVGGVLSVSTRVPNRMHPGTFRTTEIGKAEITRIEDEYAYARLTDGRTEVVEALAEPRQVLVRPEGS